MKLAIWILWSSVASFSKVPALLDHAEPGSIAPGRRPALRLGAGLWSVISPACQASFQTRQIRFVRQNFWKISDELLEGRNFAPSCHCENFDRPLALDAQFVGAPLKKLAQLFGPIIERSDRLQIVTPNPRQPLRNLRLVAPT